MILTASHSIATTADSTVNYVANDVVEVRATIGEVEIDPEEQRLRTMLAYDDMRPSEIERFINQSRIWHSMYHEREMQIRARL